MRKAIYIICAIGAIISTITASDQTLSIKLGAKRASGYKHSNFIT